MIYIFDDLNCINKFDTKVMEMLLSNQRSLQLAKLKNNESKLLGLVSYCLLCIALKSEYKLVITPTFYYLSYQKPMIKGYDEIYFNLTHSSSGVACALSKFPVGIDLESYSNNYFEIFDSVLSIEEQNQVLLSRRPCESFTKLWTLKEAVGKYYGLGVLYDLKSTNFSVIENGWNRFDDKYFYTEYTKKYAYSICSEELLEIKKISYLEFKKNIQNLYNEIFYRKDELV